VEAVVDAATVAVRICRPQSRPVIRQLNFSDRSRAIEGGSFLFGAAGIVPLDDHLSNSFLSHHGVNVAAVGFDRKMKGSCR
jgi:hypothetical protein